MRAVLSKFFGWSVSTAALVGSSYLLVGCGIVENVCVAESVSLTLDGTTSQPQSEVGVANIDHRTIDAGDARSSQVVLETKHSRFVPLGYELIWQEEFEGTELDLRKWDYRSEGRSSDGSGASILSRDCISLNGRGQLEISTGEVDGLLQTGMISTTGRFEPLYGYFEARIRFQRQQGHHGAFWLKSTSYNKFPGDPERAGVEIDIAEFFGSGRTDGGVGVNIYWNGAKGETLRRTEHVNLKPILQTKGEELCDRFHTFGLIWTSTGYVIHIDGHKVFATNDATSRRGQPIILSLLSNKWETDKLDRKKLDDSMLVDFVRVYQKPSQELLGQPTQ